MSIYIKNIDTVEHTYQGHIIEAGIYHLINSTEEPRWANDDQLLIDISNSVVLVAKDDTGNNDITDISDAINYLKGILPSEVEITAQADPPPFAEPTYRTKINAIDSPVNIPINTSTDIDFQLTAERYVSGGNMIIKNAQWGDYITAEVYDKDSIIPEAYQASLCENWPCVAKYIEKKFVPFKGETYTEILLNTKPLTAKISVGLYLRITYYAINSGEAREAILDYDLTQKL